MHGSIVRHRHLLTTAVVATAGILISLGYGSSELSRDATDSPTVIATPSAATNPALRQAAGPIPVYRVHVVESEAAAASLRASLAARPAAGAFDDMIVARTPEEAAHLLELLRAGDVFRAAAGVDPVEVTFEPGG